MGIGNLGDAASSLNGLLANLGVAVSAAGLPPKLLKDTLDAQGRALDQALDHRLIAIRDYYTARTHKRFAPRLGISMAWLTRYQKAHSEAFKATLEARFDTIFTTRTQYETLHPLLKRLHRHKAD